MDTVKDAILVQIEYYDGQDEGDDGHPYYVAFNDDLHFVTQGDTFEELLVHIRECLALCLEDTDSVKTYGVAPDAAVKLVMELPDAQTA